MTTKSIIDVYSYHPAYITIVNVGEIDATIPEYHKILEIESG